jgi:zinc/manganese transport system substrate-binding protein
LRFVLPQPARIKPAGRAGIVAGLMLGLALAAAAPASAALNVFACEPEWAALAVELGGGAVEAFSATTGRQDPHQIQARPSLIARMHRADLVVCTGAELEIGWLPILLRQSANGKVQPGAPGYFEASQAVTLLDVPASVDRAQGDVHAQGNPHLHLDPRNIAQVAAALAARLAELDPERAGLYRARLQDFARRWAAAIARWEARAAPLKRLPVVIHHKDWTYLIAWLGMRQAGLLEPKPGVPPSTSHLDALMARLKAQPARMVIRSAYQDDRPARYVADRAGIPEVVLPYTVGGDQEATDLFALFDDTLNRLLVGVK